MGSDRYLPFLPIILNWIQQTLDGSVRAVDAIGRHLYEGGRQAGMGRRQEAVQ